MMRASLFRLSPILALALLLGALLLFPAAPAQAQGPAAPTNLTVSAGVNNAELYLLWTAPSGTITGYDVHYTSAPATGAGAVADSAAASGSDPAAAWVAGTRTAAQATTAAHSIGSLTNDTTYRVRVRAKTSNANSAWVFGTGIPGAVWTATLTVDESGIYFGCSNSFGPLDNCSSSTALTEDEFRHGGATYSLDAVWWQSDNDRFYLNIENVLGQATKSALASLTLNVDGIALAINAATVDSGVIYWSYNPDTDWTDGRTVKLSLRTAAQQAVLPSSDANLLGLTATSNTSASGTFSVLSLSPSPFAAATTAYTASVRNAVTHVKLRPEVNDVNATVEVGLQGQTLTAVTSGSPSGAIALSVGANAITVKVTAQDGTTTKTYTVTVTRAQPSADADLSGLTATQAESASGTFSALTLSPSFAAATTAYTASVGNSITHLKLRPTASNAYATVEVGKGSSLTAVTSGQPSGPIALSFGANAITVEVTAENGTVKTYTVTVTRMAEQPSGAPPDAATGTDGALVSNLEQTGTGSDFDSRVHGQGFTTGPYVDGYHLTGIEARFFFENALTSEDAATVRAEVWSDSNGTPGTRVAYLSARNIPTGTTGTHRVTFEPSYGVPTTLAANTTYHFVIYTTGSLSSNTLQIELTRSAADDAGAAEGWSIADQRSNINQNTPSWTPAWTTGTASFVQIAVKGKPVSITHWAATLTVKDLGHLAGDGCIGQQQCSAQLSPGNSFTHGAWPYNVLAVRVVRGSLQLLLDRAPRLHPDQTRLDVGGRQFQFKDASESWGVARNEDAWRLTWHGTGLDWSDGDTVSVSLVGKNVPAPPTPAPNTDLHPVRVHYDEMRDGEPVDNFNNLRLASPNPSRQPGRRVELRAYIPGTFHSADPEKGIVTTTHVMLRVRAHPASTLEWAIGNVSGVTGTFAAFANGGFTPAIALNPASKWTYVYLRVTNGGQSATHLVAIDPPPRTYTLSPHVSVTEGEEAALSLSLGSPAGAGGVSFTVSADYPDGGATAEDVGQFAATLTVPEGQQSARIIIPTVDDEAVEEDEERFTVRVAHVGEPAWAVDPEGTAAAVVTIVDNDEPPAPPEGPEPWDIRVVPGDGTLTVTWNVGSRAGVEDSEIWHVLRWSQEPGVWANPRDPRAVGKNDGLSVDPGLTGYTITGLKNGVATGVFVRSMVGHRNNMSERDGNSSQWVRVKGEHTTPVAPPNAAPTVSAAIADATITNESGTHETSLAGVFGDADGDTLSVTASSSDESVATVSVAADYSTLTVSAKSHGTATVTVTASDGKGGEVADSFTVTVKSAPVVASAISDVTDLEVDATHQVSMSGVFSDADGDTVTVTQASSSDSAIAAVSAAIDGSTTAITAITMSGVSEGTATITVTAQDADGNTVSDAFDVTVSAPPNNAPTVSGAIPDATITSESGTHETSLSGVFDDADGDALTVTAASSAESVATVSVAADYSTLTVTAQSRGTATITVNASDGNGGTVDDSFAVTVKAAPVVASAIADLSELEVDLTHQVSLSGVFSDADADALIITASSSDEGKATVSVASDQSALTVSAVAEGSATVTVTAQDSDGNRVSDSFTVTVSAPANNPPTVASAISDATIVNTGGSHQLALSGVFGDADADDLTVKAASSAESVATVSVSADYSKLTVSAKSRGTATVTVMASDGNGGAVEDAFTVTVKAAPSVALAIADVSELEVDATHQVSMSGVFSDPDGDAVTVTQASSSDIAVAAVSATIDGSTSAITGLTIIAKSEGTATVTVTAQDSDGNRVSDAFDVTVNAPAAQQQVNNAPTVSAAIVDATIVNETGTHRVTLSGVFSDADGDALTVTASSSAESVATVAVSADYSTLTVSAKSRGTATVTVTAADGYGGSVADSFTVRVKAAPVVVSAIADVTGLEVGSTQDISLSGVFSDADGDALTISAASSNEATVTVSVASDGSKLTVTGVAEGTATITVTAQDTDGNTVSDTFDVSVVRAPEPEPEPVELPGPVVNLQLTATDNGIIVSWQAPESGDAPRRYIVHVRPEGGAEGSGRTKTPKAKKTKVTFDNLEAGRTYKVWVRAENEAGKGERVHTSITIPAAEDGQTGQ